MSDYLFLTGGTGLLGRYLVRDLLLRGRKLALLVRGSRRETAQQRVESILQYWEQETGHALPRPVIIEGDLREPCLGVSESDRRWISQHCDELVHSAASLTFHADGSGEPWTTNLDGTKNMLSLCEAAGIRKLHYVSTAYVCGLRDGTIYESELDCGQDFRNDYEESKLQAEQLVRGVNFLDQLTVYRPAVISGDSNTGYTNTYHGIYLYLRLMALVVPRQPIGPSGERVTKLRLRVTGDEERNVIPVDWVSKVMTHLLMTPNSHGNTFHLVPHKCVTPREIIEAGYSYYKSTGAEFVGHQEIDPSTYNELESEVLPGLAMYMNYETTDPHFDYSNLSKYAPDFPCPAIDEDMLHTYLRFGEEDRWGKRRQRLPDFDCFAWDYLTSRCKWDDDNHHSQRPLLGIDLLGPGGGQWTVSIHNHHEIVCSPGIHGETDSILRMSVSDFVELITACQKNSVDSHPLHGLFGAQVNHDAAFHPNRSGLARIRL